ncbi:MAG: NAD(P)H-dependent oxidoreductase subunit E [Ruminococcaceae bacterium]|nr:NAD(P)H-dependent oxidoreductase subunit E [Oscillospiraceae bacterium]
MKNTVVVPYTGTPEQENELKEWLIANKNMQGLTMPALQKAQEIFGYLPRVTQTIISEHIGASLEELYGIATFYSMFRLYPVGDYKISVCMGTACYVKGSQNILDKLESLLKIKEGETTPDGKFSLESCRCIGACGLAPVIMINEDVYGRLTGDELEGILAKY